ncbi:hypothetical protein QTO34_008674 [Cnephaeus nilssonii]|uniref:NADH:ubiquinone oxidoreductase complex assembly factor 8 n=1 Tax=Cnephaeus nilssonii TaxID=3371016 RepID=A0AA40LER9_CNENI|nr:hypothetical protein QTO34_008674 [Eptesicus nilssonii]
MPPPRLPRAWRLWAEVRSRGSGQHLRDGAGGGRWLGGGGEAGAARDPRAPRPRRPCPRHPSREAAAYGRCVQASTAPGGRLRKDLCAQEFEALRRCFAAAAKDTLKAGP